MPFPERGVSMDDSLLGEEVLYSSPTGTYKRVRRWYRGRNPQLNGQYVIGLCGNWETMVEVDVITPTQTFTVPDCNS